MFEYIRTTEERHVYAVEYPKGHEAEATISLNRIRGVRFQQLTYIDLPSMNVGRFEIFTN